MANTRSIILKCLDENCDYLVKDNAISENADDRLYKIISPAEPSFPETAVKYDIVVVVDGSEENNSFSIECYYDWIKIRRNRNNVTISLTTNFNNETRNGIVRFRHNSSQYVNATLTIEQSKMDYMLKVIPSNNVDFKYEANVTTYSQSYHIKDNVTINEESEQEILDETPNLGYCSYDLVEYLYKNSDDEIIREKQSDDDVVYAYVFREDGNNNIISEYVYSELSLSEQDQYYVYYTKDDITYYVKLIFVNEYNDLTSQHETYARYLYEKYEYRYIGRNPEDDYQENYTPKIYVSKYNDAILISPQEYEDLAPQSKRGYLPSIYFKSDDTNCDLINAEDYNLLPAKRIITSDEYELKGDKEKQDFELISYRCTVDGSVKTVEEYDALLLTNNDYYKDKITEGKATKTVSEYQELTPDEKLKYNLVLYLNDVPEFLTNSNKEVKSVIVECEGGKGKYRIGQIRKYVKRKTKQIENGNLIDADVYEEVGFYNEIIATIDANGNVVITNYGNANSLYRTNTASEDIREFNRDVYYTITLLHKDIIGVSEIIKLRYIAITNDGQGHNYDGNGITTDLAISTDQQPAPPVDGDGDDGDEGEADTEGDGSTADEEVIYEINVEKDEYVVSKERQIIRINVQTSPSDSAVYFRGSGSFIYNYDIDGHVVKVYLTKNTLGMDRTCVCRIIHAEEPSLYKQIIITQLGV